MPFAQEILADRPTEERGPQSRAIAAGLVLLALFLGGLFYYKWGGSVKTISAVWSSSTWTKSPDGLIKAHPVASTVFYLSRIWIALVYGVLIGAAVRAFVSPRQVARLLSRGSTVRRQVLATGAGAPLMLCSCCVTPVFTAVYERGARLGAALAIMLASPALNPAALILTFILFPARVATTRLVGAVIAVVVLPLILERIAGRNRLLAIAQPADNRAEDGPTTPATFLARFVRSLGYIAVVTVPLILIGVFTSSLVIQANASLRPADTMLGVLLAATVAVPLALPTFFEIPIALIALAAGAPGLAAVILFAGPIVNLPSLLIVGREVGPKASIALAAGVWILAVCAGLAVLAA